MIQRIQTIYLLAASILLGLMIQNPIASFLIDDKVYDLLSYKLVNSADEKDMIFTNYPLAVLIGIAAVLALVTIFFYKNRKLQMRFTLFNWILTLSIYIMIGYYYYQIQSVKEVLFTFRVQIVFPLIAFILLFLAFKGIKKDEEIIQSLNRIR